MTPNGRRRHKQRKKASKNLWRKYRGDPTMRCVWCGVEIVHVGAIRKANRIELKRGFFTYRTLGGRVVTKAQASVDHYIPLRDSNDSEAHNLVPSCVRCNVNRNATDSPYSDEARRTCQFCGGKKMKGKARCNECFRKIVAAWKVNQTLAQLVHIVDPLPLALR